MRRLKMAVPLLVLSTPLLIDEAVAQPGGLGQVQQPSPMDLAFRSLSSKNIEVQSFAMVRSLSMPTQAKGAASWVDGQTLDFVDKTTGQSVLSVNLYLSDNNGSGAAAARDLRTNQPTRLSHLTPFNPRAVGLGQVRAQVSFGGQQVELAAGTQLAHLMRNVRWALRQDQTRVGSGFAGGVRNVLLNMANGAATKMHPQSSRARSSAFNSLLRGAYTNTKVWNDRPAVVQKMRRWHGYRGDPAKYRPSGPVPLH